MKSKQALQQNSSQSETVPITREANLWVRLSATPENKAQHKELRYWQWRTLYSGRNKNGGEFQLPTP